MKFIRRPDLTPHTRIEMVKLAWLNQGIYGKMTHIAQEYHISKSVHMRFIHSMSRTHRYDTLTRVPSVPTLCGLI
jgi:hypothetical protein